MIKLNRILCFFVIVGGFILSSCESNDTKERVAIMVAGINKKCPVLIDEETLFKGVTYDNKQSITYTYQLIHFQKEKVDTAAFRKALWPGLLANIKVDSKMQDLRTEEFSFLNIYLDKDEKELCRILIGPKDYLPAEK